MKIILSRKGFDSSSGGLCNPILPDGTLLSFPIPGESLFPVKYSDLSYPVVDEKGVEHQLTYEEILVQLSNGKWDIGKQCHLDPDIRKEICNRPEKWIPAFGQSENVKKFLDKMKVQVGDLFLFFGRFRRTEFGANGQLNYVKAAPEQHIIYGYMQVGEILHNDQIEKRFQWHPHCGNGRDNNLYIPTKKLSFNSNLPGYGTLKYASKRVLTAYGMSISKWQLPDFFRGLNMQVETKNDSLLSSFHDAPDGQSYFQFIGRGQEFVLSAYHQERFYNFYEKSLEEWAYRIITEFNWDDVLERLYQEKLQYDFGKIKEVMNVQNGALVTDSLGYVTDAYNEQKTYCRYYHRIMEFNEERCDICPLFQGGANGMGADCEYDIPVFENEKEWIPEKPRDRYAFYELLIQKGVLHRKKVSWDNVVIRESRKKQ